VGRGSGQAAVPADKDGVETCRPAESGDRTNGESGSSRQLCGLPDSGCVAVGRRRRFGRHGRSCDPANRVTVPMEPLLTARTIERLSDLANCAPAPL
jgi:hypothetical protein